MLKPKTPKKLSFSVCSVSLYKVTCQYLLLLVGFDTLTYRKHYDRSHRLVGHQGVTVLLACNEYSFPFGPRVNRASAQQIVSSHRRLTRTTWPPRALPPKSPMRPAPKLFVEVGSVVVEVEGEGAEEDGRRWPLGILKGSSSPQCGGEES